VFIAFRSQHSPVDPAAIIPNDNAQTPGSIFELDFNTPRTGAPEGIDQCFATDTIDFIAYSLVQYSGPAC